MSQHRPFFAVLVLYLALTIAYGLVNPLFEAPDEHWHFFTAEYVATQHTLPIVDDPYDTWLSQEAAQPPLYYMLGAILIAPFDTSSTREQVWLNPYFPLGVGRADAPANRNNVVHTETWSDDYVRAGHLLRLFSTLLGAGTLGCIYGCGLLMQVGEKKALLATAVVAVLPQFNFLHASITNDTLMIFLASLALWQLLRLFKMEQYEDGLFNWRLLQLAVTVGFAILTKTTGTALLAYMVGALGLFWLNRWWDGTLSTRFFGRLLVYFVLPTLALASWLWWRNWVLYGDITAVNQFVRIAGGDRAYTLWQVWQETAGLWRSLFGVFGWFNLLPSAWFYWLWNGIVLVSVAGFIWGRWQDASQSEQRYNLRSLLLALQNPPILLLIWFVVVYAGLTLFMLRTPAAQGRLLFPAIVPLALGLTWGLSQWERVQWVWPSLGLLSSLYVLVFVIPPAYAWPSLVETSRPLGQLLAEGVELVATPEVVETVTVGETAVFPLHWRKTQPLKEPPVLVLELYGMDLATPIGKTQSYHGGGLYPATLWPLEKVVNDVVGVQVEPHAEAPVLASAFALILDGEATEVGKVKIVPPVWPDPHGQTIALFGNGIRLVQAEPSTPMIQAGETLTLTVQWVVDVAPEQFLTTFVHLGEGPLAVGDNVARNGRYPTSYWSAGEVIDDWYTISLPPNLPAGTYPIWLGLYEPTPPYLRQPAFIGDIRQTNDAVLVGEITILEPK